MISANHLLRASATLALGATVALIPVSAQRTASPVPTFQVDPFWPKPLPNHWILGSVTGVAVDAQDHIWLVHRGMDSLTARTEAGLATTPPTAESCCAPAPPVLEFDQAGTLLNSWGGTGQGYDWPRTPAGITVDAKGNVWIAGTAETGGVAGRVPPPTDAHVLKFSRDGKFLLQIGQPGKIEGSFSKTTLNRPAGFSIDAAAREVYVADGLGNRRVVVFDLETGTYKRHWGAYGQPTSEAPSPTYDPDKPPDKQFNVVSCVEIARDGMVYVCDRRNNRVQVFRKDGKFVKEGVRLARRRSARDRRGTSRFRAIRSSASSTSPTVTIRKSSSCGATRSRSSPASATAGDGPVTSTASAASRSIQRATSIRARPRGQTTCRSSCPKAVGRTKGVGRDDPDDSVG